MLIVSFDELTKADLTNYAFSIGDEQILRFCIDIKHKLLCFGSEKEDHIKQGETLLNQEQNTECLDEKEIAKLLLDHIVGGSIFLENSNPKNAFILLGGSSVEQGLNLILKQSHSKHSFVTAQNYADRVFKKFHSFLRIKVNFK